MEQIKNLEGLANYFHGLADCTIQPFDKLYGICHQVDCLFDMEIIAEDVAEDYDHILYLDNYFKSWDNFSGSYTYPVPSTDTEYPAAVNMFDSILLRNGSMWTGAYGDLRKDLCRHIAKEIERLIEVN